MTTSPFGTPNPFANPEATSSAATPVALPAAPVAARSKRTPLLIGLVGVAAAAAVGTGLFFFSQSGDDKGNDAAIALPSDAEGVPSDPSTTPTDTSTPLPTVTQFNGRNPFAAQLVEGGGGAAASTPIPQIAVSTGSSALTGGGGTGAGAGAAGQDGSNGSNGSDGTNGKDGAAGAKGDKGDTGDTPAYVQVTFRGGVAGNPLITTDDVADFDVVSLGRSDPAFAIEDGELLGTEAPTTWVRFLKLNLDIGGEPVSALVQVGDDATYVLPLNQAMVLFQAGT